MKAVIDALNVVYEEREKRSLVKLNLLSLGFTIGGIATLLVMVRAVVAFPLAVDHLGLKPQSQFIIGLARWPLMFLVLMTALAVLYRFGPSRREARWQWLSIGALLASVLWIAGFCGAVLVSLQLRKLQRHLWFARGCHRPDDVDVDVRNHRAVRGGAELGNRASDRSGFDRRSPEAHGRPRRRYGGHAGSLGFNRAKRTLGACLSSRKFRNRGE